MGLFGGDACAWSPHRSRLPATGAVSARHPSGACRPGETVRGYCGGALGSIACRQEPVTSYWFALAPALDPRLPTCVLSPSLHTDCATEAGVGSCTFPITPFTVPTSRPDRRRRGQVARAVRLRARLWGGSRPFRPAPTDRPQAGLRRQAVGVGDWNRVGVNSSITGVGTVLCCSRFETVWPYSRASTSLMNCALRPFCLTKPSISSNSTSR